MMFRPNRTPRAIVEGMGSGYRSVADKLRLLRLATTLGSVTRACEKTRFSRDSYYRLKDLYKRRGKAALKPMTRRRPLLAQRVAPAIDAGVVRLAQAEPGWGAVRVAQTLRFRISASGVRRVWLRHGLTTRRLRGFVERPPERQVQRQPQAVGAPRATGKVMPQVHIECPFCRSPQIAGRACTQCGVGLPIGLFQEEDLFPRRSR